MTEKPSHIKIGDRVSFTPVEPWDLVTETGSGPFEGIVVAVDDRSHKAIVFRLDRPLTFGPVSALLFLAFTRAVAEHFTTDAPSKTTFCYVDSITEAQVARVIAEPRLEKRGELSMLGDVTWTTTLES
jgi:hypothetical protein